MTSTVKVTAHCGKEKRVRVIRTNPDEVNFLNDGESLDTSIFDNRAVTAVEELREVEAPAAEARRADDTAETVVKVQE